MKQEKVCKVEGCKTIAGTKGFCIKHYGRFRRHGDPEKILVRERNTHVDCKISGCFKNVEALGYCTMHYKRVYRYGTPDTVKKVSVLPKGVCEIQKCSKPSICLIDLNGKPKEVCQRHYRQWSLYGKITSTGRSQKDPNKFVMEDVNCFIYLADIYGNFNGLKAIVDADDYLLIKDYKWYKISHKRKNGIVRHLVYSDTIKPRVALHQLVMGISPTGDRTKTQHVDHINGDTLDNRKSNLRFCTPSENSMNSAKRKKEGYKGVTKNRNRWIVQLAGKYIGSYKSEIRAAQVYNKEARKQFGEFALLNNIQCNSKENL